MAPRSAGVPGIMEPNSPFSAAIAATVAGPFHQVSLFGDWDGREDFTVDHEGKVDEFSAKIPPATQGFTLTRVAVSAHSIANGYNENVFYYGDSLGNVYVAQSPTLGTQNTPLPPGGLTAPNIFTINLPTSLNAFGTLNSDSNIVITGLAVSPVTDLTSYANVNGAYAPYAGLVGEILYVTFWDTGGGLRLSSNNTLVRSGVIAFPIADVVSGAPLPPAIVSPLGFPVQVGGSFGLVFSVFSNIAGCAVDDDGNLFFQQVDLVGFTGANIVKVTDIGSNQDRSLAVSGILTITTLNPANGNYSNTSGPAQQVNRFTNYSGTSATFGNITALATGPANTVYAAVARSFDASDAAAQATMGPFAAPAATGPLPAMVISFADAVGTMTGTPAGVVVRDGIADQATTGEPLVPGVNNFRVYVHGNGPEKRLASGSSPVFGTVSNTLKLDMQIDFGIYNGLVVDEAAKLYVVSGGSPNGFGSNPSPTRTEVLLFSDDKPADRRGDYVDFRGDALPNPPLSGGNVGDGDSDRFDHIFWQAPTDLTASPAGVAGLARGFLRYLNRVAPNAITNLPNGTTQGDDAASGPILFSDFDPGAQVGGGDDQNPPFRGDDSDGGGTPADPGALRGGFEFAMAGTVVGVCTAPWNAFHLNSNGNITFNSGDVGGIPLAGTFLSGAPRVAGAWGDINPASRGGGNLNTFPVQAVGFAGVNQFKVRWINVPEFGQEANGSSNTFDISLLDDGTGLDENSNQPLNPANPIGNNAVPFDQQEGPTDLRFIQLGAGLGLAGVSPRANGTPNFRLTYGRMDVLGTPAVPVLAGFTIGEQPPVSVTEIDLSEVGRATPLGNLTEKAIFELFSDNDFDLRFEGNDAAAATPGGQPDLNRDTLDFVGTPCTITFPAVSGTKTVSGVFEVGETITYTIVLTNNGIVALVDAPLTAEFIDVLPPELTLVSASATAGTATTDIPQNAVRWDGSLAPAASVTITITADITSGTGGLPVANQGIILGPSVSDVTDDPGTPAADDPTLTPPVIGAPPTITITSPTINPTFTATTLTVNLAGTAADDIGVTSVTWSTDHGASGTATGTTNWTATIPLLVPGVTVITVTATDTSNVTATDTLTVSVNELLYYLAEGATGSFFDTDIAIANPNPVAAPIKVTFLRPGATPVVIFGVVGANSRHTITADAIPGVQDTAVSAVVSSTSAVPLLVERTMRWDPTQYGSHGEKAVTEPSTTWYFAEGSQGFFDTFVLLANANVGPATVTVTFLREFGSPVVQNIVVEPSSRFTLWTNLVPELADRSFSIVVESDVPIIAERAMYFGTPLFNGGHESAGVTAPSTSWFLAEGATGPFFDMYVLIGNPNAASVDVTLTYLLVGGGTVVKAKTIPANTRLTVNVELEDPLLAAAAVSVEVDATLPVVAERAMYWPGDFSTWYEAHNSFGLTETATKWGLAEGQVGGLLTAETFILLANPTNTAAEVEITYLRTNGSTVVKNYSVGPTSRLNVYVNGEVPELNNESFGAVVNVTNAVPIAVERAMYFSPGGVLFAAGTNVSAIPLP